MFFIFALSRVGEGTKSELLYRFTAFFYSRIDAIITPIGYCIHFLTTWHFKNRAYIVHRVRLYFAPQVAKFLWWLHKFGYKRLRLVVFMLGLILAVIGVLPQH